MALDGHKAAYVRMCLTFFIMIGFDLIHARLIGKSKLARDIIWSSTVSNSKIVGTILVFASSDMTHCIQHNFWLVWSLPSWIWRVIISSGEESRRGLSSLSDQLCSAGGEDLTLLVLVVRSMTVFFFPTTFQWLFGGKFAAICAYDVFPRVLVLFVSMLDCKCCGL